MAISVISRLNNLGKRIFSFFNKDIDAVNLIEHNKINFGVSATKAKKKAVVLFELNGMCSEHIAYSYLSNILANAHQAAISAYSPLYHESLVKRINFRIKSLFKLNEFGIYKSFGTEEFFEIAVNKRQKLRAKDMLIECNSKLHSKSDIERMEIDGVLVGDLIYDSYLMNKKVPTIDRCSSEFQEFLLSTLEQLIFWLDYFDRKCVKAINVSHCVYTLAIPLRVAIARNIPAYQIGLTHAYRLNENRLFAYKDFEDYPSTFSMLPPAQQRGGILEAKKRIARRFSGEIGVDMSYSSKSAYCSIQYPRLIKETLKPKVLIATHCFFDSPHSYGNNLFPDFWEWLNFLGKFSEAVDYDWYIKTHPDYLEGTRQILENFINKYKNFVLLPSDSSHHQIVREGIDVALTVYGTIGFEYAALGIPVINASQNNPHIAYSFNIHPKDEIEYRQYLEKIGDILLTIDTNEVYEFYYMHNIYNTQDIFMENYKDILEDIGGYDAQFTTAIYKAWVKSWTPDKHRDIMKRLDAFINSGDFRLNANHFKNLNCKAGTLNGSSL